MGHDEIRGTVHEVILDVLKERTPGREQINDGESLNRELGLSSLELARITAMLEMRLDADPFSQHVSVTSVRTVGDLSNAYITFLDAKDAPKPETDNLAAQSTDRAARRLEANRTRGPRSK
ncbi:MAG: hypothetical protein NVSMB1_01300 [Polyangiales bacterium]